MLAGQKNTIFVALGCVCVCVWNEGANDYLVVVEVT